MVKTRTFSSVIGLGDYVRDRVTGFKGIVTGITYFLNGCVRVAVQGEKLNAGVPTEVQWIDDVQLTAVTKSKLTVRPEVGGDRPAVRRASDPGR